MIDMKKLLILLPMICLSSLEMAAQDNLEMKSEFPTGYVKATNPYEFRTIDGVLYACYSNGIPYVLVRYPAEAERQTFTIPSTVGRISRGAFQGCKNLKELEIPQSVYYIGDNAFENASISRFIVTGADDAASNISAAKATTSEMAIYDTAGRKIEKPKSGINIQQMADKSTRKILVE